MKAVAITLISALMVIASASSSTHGIEADKREVGSPGTELEFAL